MSSRITGFNLFRSLGNRPFALLWGGQSLSRIGDFLYQIALVWWVMEETGSPTAMASVLVFSYGPTVLFLLIGGVAVDRYSRIRIMLASDLARGLMASLVAVLAFTDRLEIWHVYTLSLAFGLVDAFFQPAYMAAVPHIVSEEDLSSANSLTSLSLQAGRIAGPPLGAALVALGGTGTAFALDGLTFLISTAILLPLRDLDTLAGAQVQSQGERGSPIADFKEGIKTVVDTPWLWVSIAIFALSNITLAGPYSVSLPFLVQDHLGADVKVLGFLYGLFAAGYVLGGLWMGRKARIRRRGRLLHGGLFLAGVMIFAFGLPVGMVGLALAALINGAALEVGGLAWTNSLQELVPREKLGRVASVDSLGSFALLPVGYGLVGWATEILGPPLIFILGGGLTAFAAAFTLRHPAIRSMD